MSGYRRRPTWIFWIALALMLAAIRFWADQQQPSIPEALVDGIYRVDRVVDGDTLLLQSGARIRLQGIDTPETVREDTPVERWGPEASEFAKQFVREARGEVRLTFGRERIDRYGRFLAFVWHDEEMLNEELVLNGLAQARMDYRYSAAMKRRLRAAQEEAQEYNRGMWSDSSDE